MSDYTPTTRDVTAYYCHARQEGTGVTVEEGAHERFHAEFDRWLASELAIARVRELHRRQPDTISGLDTGPALLAEARECVG